MKIVIGWWGGGPGGLRGLHGRENVEIIGCNKYLDRSFFIPWYNAIGYLSVCLSVFITGCVIVSVLIHPKPKLCTTISRVRFDFLFQLNRFSHFWVLRWHTVTLTERHPVDVFNFKFHAFTFQLPNYRSMALLGYLEQSIFLWLKLRLVKIMYLCELI